jgi:hypothetical protein
MYVGIRNGMPLKQLSDRGLDRLEGILSVDRENRAHLSWTLLKQNNCAQCVERETGLVAGADLRQENWQTSSPILNAMYLVAEDSQARFPNGTTRPRTAGFALAWRLNGRDIGLPE